jgi:hypothetical protein
MLVSSPRRVASTIWPCTLLVPRPVSTAGGGRGREGQPRGANPRRLFLSAGKHGSKRETEQGEGEERQTTRLGELVGGGRRAPGTPLPVPGRLIDLQARGLFSSGSSRGTLLRANVGATGRNQMGDLVASTPCVHAWFARAYSPRRNGSAHSQMHMCGMHNDPHPGKPSGSTLLRDV